MSVEEDPHAASATESPAVKVEQDTAMTDVPVSLAWEQANPRKQIPSPSAEIPPTHTVTTATIPRASDMNGATNIKASVTMPTEAAHHGAPTRDWLNTKVTGVLLEGMKLLAAERPEAPLRALAEYLLRRSAEIEGTAGEGLNGQ